MKKEKKFSTDFDFFRKIVIYIEKRYNKLSYGCNKKYQRLFQA